MEKREASRHRFSWRCVKWTLSECRKDTAVSLFNSQTSWLRCPPVRGWRGAGEGGAHLLFFTSVQLPSFCTTPRIRLKIKQHGLRHIISTMWWFTVLYIPGIVFLHVCVRDKAVHVLRAHLGLQLFSPCASLHAWLPLLSVVKCIKACDRLVLQFSPSPQSLQPRLYLSGISSPTLLPHNALSITYHTPSPLCVCVPER